MLLDGQRLQGDLPNRYRLHPQADPAPAAKATTTSATTAVAQDVPWYSWSKIEANIGFWAPLVFMGREGIVIIGIQVAVRQSNGAEIMLAVSAPSIGNMLAQQ